MGGGGKNKGGAPAAPDFSKLAMVNQSNPMGGSSWSQDANGNMSLSSQFGGQAGNAFQGLLGGMASGSQMDPAQAGQAAQNKVMDFYTSRLDPRWNANQNAFDAKMANMGLDPGTEASNNAARQFGEQRNDAYNQAGASAVQLGLGEQQQARANAALPFGLASGMLNMLPQGDANSPMKAGMAQYGAEKDRVSMNNAKKGQTLSGLGDIAGLAFGA